MLNKAEFVLLMALSWPAFAAQSPEQSSSSTPTAQEILDRMGDVYLKCRSYRDTGLLKTTVVPVEIAWLKPPYYGNDSRVTRFSRPFQTSFVRPARFRFECSDIKPGKASRFVVWGDGDDVKTWWDVKPGVEHPGSMSMAVARATGASGGSAHTVPRMLMPLLVTGGALVDIADAERLPDARIDDVPCFVLKGRFWESDTTLWIDQRTYLLRLLRRMVDTEVFRVETTTSYQPEADVEIGAEEFIFDPPSSETLRQPLPPSEDVELRFEKAKHLVEAREYAAALEEFVWLWDATNNLESAFEPYIRPTIIEGIGELAALDPAARSRFEAVFGDLDAKVRTNAKPVFRYWMDWADLGRALGLDDRIVGLYLERRSPQGSLRMFDDFHPYALDDLFDILIERKLYADAGRIYEDPLRTAESTLEIFGVDETSRLHALTLAAGKTDAAAAIVRLVLDQNDSVEARHALARYCLQFGVPCDSVPTWIEDIRRSGGDVTELEALMAGRPHSDPPSAHEP